VWGCEGSAARYRGAASLTVSSQSDRSAPVETDPTRIAELLVGLSDVNVLGVEEEGFGITVMIETRGPRPACVGCGVPGRVKDRDEVTLVDLPYAGRPSRLVWRKHRWQCLSGDCAVNTWTLNVPAIAPARLALTDRAGRWATRQVGQHGRSVRDVAAELDCDWHTVNDAVQAYGTALLETGHRIGAVNALGLDETLFVRQGPRHLKQWATSIVDVRRGVLLDMIEGRTAQPAIDWLGARPTLWRDQIEWGTLDLSGPYRKVFTEMLGHARQIADPFHVVKLVNSALDETRRRVQNETMGHRGHKHDPLYRARRLLTKADERLDETGRSKLLGLLEAGDPRGEVRMAWHAKEVVREIYSIDDPKIADEFVARLAGDLQDESCPPEINRVGRTLARWHPQITNWHRAKVSNAATESANNLIKRIKRVAFGFRTFAYYRVRALLYAGRPNWDLLASVTPR
jgi:transposase